MPNSLLPQYLHISSCSAALGDEEICLDYVRRLARLVIVCEKLACIDWVQASQDELLLFPLDQVDTIFKLFLWLDGPAL